MLLIALWAMLWVSQAFAACCGPHGGMHHQSTNPGVEIHAIVQSEHERHDDSKSRAARRRSMRRSRSRMRSSAWSTMAGSRNWCCNSGYANGIRGAASRG